MNKRPPTTTRVVGVTDKFHELLDEQLNEPAGAPAGARALGGQGGAKPPLLMPLLSELFILTKNLEVVRLGDVINYAQIDFVHRCERQLAHRGMIRMCVLKARQIGISTVIEGIAFVMSMMHDNFRSKIISHEDKSAKSILAMTKHYWNTYIFKRFHNEKYNGASHLSWDNGSDIDIATAKNAGAGRSQTLQLIHASEVAFWLKPRELMTGLVQSVPTFGLNAIFLESTANGVGNYFHAMCNASMKQRNEYEFCFYPWFEHPEYTAAFLPPGQVDHIDLADTSGMTTEEVDEEARLRKMFKLTDDRLLWRRWAIENKCQGSLQIFHQEYPATPHEAFISTGTNVFPLGKLLDHYEPLIGVQGRLRAERGTVRFDVDPNGPLTIFAEPSADPDWGVYVLGADPSHTAHGDNACIQVINRRTLEQVAVFRAKLDPITFGKELQLLGRYYNTGLLAPERTGPGYATVGCVVADGYVNVYAMQDVAKLQGTPLGGMQGWVTNTQTKELAISHLRKAFLDPLVMFGARAVGLVIHDEETMIELRDYVTSERGGYENGDGAEFDDGVMALAIAITVHNIEPPPPVYEELPAERVAAIPNAKVNKRTRGPSTRQWNAAPTDKRVAKPGTTYQSIEVADLPEDFDDDHDDEPIPPWQDWKE